MRGGKTFRTVGLFLEGGICGFKGRAARATVLRRRGLGVLEWKIQ